jgi:pyruvate/2-oxoglutarate/acetoin dehydrogenase E1 component
MNTISYKQALNETIAEEMRRDENIIVIGEDIGLYGGKFGVTKGLIEIFGPRRIIETPISETAFTGAAVGASLLGLRPIIDIMFGDFTTLASDPIINHAAKYYFMSGGQVKAPIVVRTTFGTGTGAAAQHSQSLESMFLNTPGLKIVAPATPYDAKGLLKSALRDDAPVLFFEHKLLYKTTGDVPDTDYTVPIGKANVLKEGRCISLISYSNATQLLHDGRSSARKGRY